MEEISWAKTIYDRNRGFIRVALSEEEQTQLLEFLRDAHARCMTECLEDAKKITQSVLGRAAPSNTVRVACALFGRKATATYSLVQEALRRKAHAARNGGE